MNHASIIKITNRVALYATIALFYWVVTFLTITIFDLKIFRGHMTETFYLSILGIFAILGGSIVLNLMSNLSKISESITVNDASTVSTHRSSRVKFYTAVASVPVIVGLLFAGNALSAQKKKELLVSAAQAMVAENQKELSKLAVYEFSNAYVEDAAKILSVMAKIDKNFPEVKVIVPDSIGDKRVFLAFQGNTYDSSKKVEEKQDYIYSSTKDERAYLENAFAKSQMDMRFRAESGNYELYLPLKLQGKVIVLYFSDFQRYGKFGS
jgi:hypothetical protein